VDSVAPVLAAALGRHLQTFAGQLRELTAGLSEDQFWTRPYPYGNSVGHLVLHLTGNLNYYIGAEMAGTGYVRDREREFGDTSRQPKADVMQALDAAVAMTVKTIDAQSPEDWGRDYRAIRSDEPNRLSMVLRCVEHFHHHLGQIIYLAREHARQRVR
jgi:hypothetical protein